MKYHEFGIPRRISYLIDPQGTVHKSYDLEESGAELSEHADEVLQDIIAAS
jgi:peroxiredoxin|tara:strand:+ start:333 stop:485 length:153 start_codon:yes stop_codon:yes gene_type:complete